MKKLLLLLFALISIATSAQLDREHWFAPMVDRAVNGSNYQTIKYLDITRPLLIIS